ncbi:MAG: ribonuclease J [Deltaproteobacteria bacterium]|nr:ribonuclease J [Deltaproteobacteria bacterium]MBW2136937.1 ribonuclease J [Deltaproteobacteria bacterium]
MVKIIPLGGVGEIGLNMLVLACEDYMLIIDAGLMFPEEYMPGVDIVIPDFQFLRENRDKVRSVILTHGHEDHIGAMPFFLQEINIPVYGTSFTIELLKEKLKEHRLLGETTLQKVRAGEKTRFGPLTVEYIKVNHSTVDGVGLAIHTPEGIIIHSGDFKIDRTPVDGNSTDLRRFAHYGKKDVLLLLSDSTNAEKEGFTLSEREVRRTLDELFKTCQGRLIIAVFASNILRIQQVLKLAVAYNRRVLFSGKSMRMNVKIAKEEGFIQIPPELEINERDVDRIPGEQVVIITTGSQGEPMSSLTRMAHNRHKGLKIKEGDTVVLSSRFIPGNEKAITKIINNLYRMGAEVVYEKVSDIHSSGHAYREELKMMLNMVKPKYFIPVHGEYRHLVKHIQLAEEWGMPRERLILAENGTSILIQDGVLSIGERVPTGRVFVDGKGIGDVDELVLRDRRRLSGDGVVIALLALDEQTGGIVYGPDIISRGFVFEDQGGFILDEAKNAVLEVLEEIVADKPIEWGDLEPKIKKRLKRLFYKIIERRPLVLPIVIPV